LRELFGIEGLTGAGFEVLKGSPLSKTLHTISIVEYKPIKRPIKIRQLPQNEVTI